MYYKTIFFLVIDVSLASDNPLRFIRETFRKNIKMNNYNGW